MIKVLLVQCPLYDVEMPPLGIAQLAASLKSRNIPVEVLDINIDFFHNNQQYHKFWMPENYAHCMPLSFFLGQEELDKFFDHYAKKILETNAGIIGLSVQTTSNHFSIGLSAKIKALDPSKIIIFGGPECSREIVFGYWLLMPGKGDYMVLGEGEEILPEFVEKISQGKAATECRGLVMKEGERIFDTGKREGIADLDKLPAADFSLFKLDRYLHKEALPVLTSRGCLRKCVFCFDTGHQGVYRHRSSEKIVEEISYLYHNYSLRRLKFNDLLINGDLKLLEDICDNLIPLRLNDLYWSGNMITREGMTEAFFRKMYRAGLRSVTFGLETASPNVLKRMGKYYPLRKLKEMLKAVTLSGINVETNWIVGFPGETRKDLFNTMKFIANNRRYIHSTSAANCLEILRGSILFRNTGKFNIRFSSDNTWCCDQHDLAEREYRKRLFNNFLLQTGTLNRTQSTNDPYRKKEVCLFEAKKILRSLRKQLKLPFFL